ncbi:hypothetical protein M0802_000991 [Mischocyttarus mexicanus]|nr:hypothetical protein M0802_000991 [Mischocyttarus mexicanus]
MVVVAAKRMWLTPWSNRAFAGLLHPETVDKRDSPEQKFPDTYLLNKNKEETSGSSIRLLQKGQTLRANLGP